MGWQMVKNKIKNVKQLKNRVFRCEHAPGIDCGTLVTQKSPTGVKLDFFPNRGFFLHQQSEIGGFFCTNHFTYLKLICERKKQISIAVFELYAVEGFIVQKTVFRDHGRSL